MKDMMIFDNPEFGQIRMIEINGKPYAVGNDVARALEYARPHEAITAHCKGAVTYRILTNGGTQDAKVIPEGDIYRLIYKAAEQSKNPEIKAKAARFESWIFDEVLPSIRMTGIYSIQAQFKIPQTYAEALRELADTWEQKEAVLKELEEARPKVEQYEILLSAKNAQTISEIAKCYGWGRNRLFEFLREKKVLRYNNEPYQEHIDAGRFEVRIVPLIIKGEVINKPQTLVTPKGIDFIGKLIKSEGA